MKQLTIISIASILALTACNKEPIDSGSSISEEILYFSSYEDASDLDGYEGHEGSIVEEAPVDGGDFSLKIQGGCVTPHLHFKIGPYLEGKKISMSFQGRSEGSGTIFLSSNVVPTPMENIIIEGSDWESYNYNEIYELEAGAILDVTFISGGIMATATWIDELKLYVPK